MMFPLMTFFFPSPPQRPRGSRKERPVPDVFQAPQRGKPVGGAREFPVGALQPLQHPWKDLPVWELPVFRQPGWKPVPCHHSNARGNAKQRRHYFVLENTAKKKKKRLLKSFLHTDGEQWRQWLSGLLMFLQVVNVEKPDSSSRALTVCVRGKRALRFSEVRDYQRLANTIRSRCGISASPQHSASTEVTS